MSKTSTSIRSYALAAVIALGITVVWSTVVVWTLGIVESASYQRGPYEQLYIGSDGEPYILRYPSGMYSRHQEVLTLSREPATADPGSLLAPMYLSRRLRGESTYSQQLAGVSDRGTPATLWYLVHDGRAGGRAYGVGYHSLTKQVVGYFGRKGFTQQRPVREEWFEIAGKGLNFSTPNVTFTEPSLDEHVLFLLSEGKLWSIDSLKREVRVLAEAPSDASIGWAWDLRDANQPPPRDWRASTAWAPKTVLIRSTTTCTLVDRTTGERSSYPIPPDVGNELLATSQLADGNVLLIYGGFVSRRSGVRVRWVTPGGAVVRRSELELAQLGTGMGGEETFAWLAALAVPLLAGQAPIVGLIPAVSVLNGQADSYAEAFRRAVGYSWPAWLVLVVIGLIAAVAAYRRQKRFGLSGAWGWAIFAFFFGVPGWISYRFHRTWPALEECPACQQAAPRNRSACIECGADFPPPPLKGIEVFA